MDTCLWYMIYWPPFRSSRWRDILMVHPSPLFGSRLSSLTPKVQVLKQKAPAQHHTYVRFLISKTLHVLLHMYTHIQTSTSIMINSKYIRYLDNTYMYVVLLPLVLVTTALGSPARGLRGLRYGPCRSSPARLPPSRLRSGCPSEARLVQVQGPY